MELLLDATHSVGFVATTYSEVSSATSMHAYNTLDVLIADTLLSKATNHCTLLCGVGMSLVCVQYNTGKRKSVKNGEGLGTPIT